MAEFKKTKSLFMLLSSVLISSALFIIISCSPKTKEHKPAEIERQESIAPQRILIANLPDSNKPVSIFLKNVPKPWVADNPKPPTVYSFVDSTKGLPMAPQVQGMGFITHFTTEQGLALDGISCAFLDGKGNLWFGTNGGGVSRYDGKNFTGYTVAHGLADNHVNSIMEDKNGNLWFTTLNGVSRYDGRTFTNYTTKHGLASNVVRTACVDRKGNLWFGTKDRGVSRYNEKGFESFTTEEGLANNNVVSVAEDRSGNVWFGTWGGGLSCYDGKRFVNYTTEKGLRNNYISKIAVDKKGNIWFGTSLGGVSCFDGKQFKDYIPRPGSMHSYIASIAEDKKGNIWFGTWNGRVGCYDGDEVVDYTGALGLSNNSVISITEDKIGNLWFGTWGDGIIRYQGKSIISYTKQQGLAHNLVFGIAEDRKGDIWFGTAGGGVSRYNGKNFTNYSTPQGMADDNINCISVDGMGNLWFGLGSGINCYDGKQFINYTRAQGLASNSISCIAEDNNKNLWFGTNGAGISRYDGESFTNFTTSQGLADNTVNSVTKDKAGNLWFATNHGISRFDGKGFTNYTTLQGLKNNVIYGATEDKYGNIWVGTNGGGVSRFDGKSFVNYTTTQGLADNSVITIIIDSASNIIFGTNYGLARLVSFTSNSTGEKKAIIIGAQNHLSNEELTAYSPKFEIYNSSTGYPIKDMNTLSMISDSKGIIWMGTGATRVGLVRFDYSAIHNSSDPPFVVLHKIKINNENVCWYDLLPPSARKGMNYGPDTTAENIIEEMSTLGKVLSDEDRDSMRIKFGDIQFDSVRPFYPIPENLVLPYRQNNVTFDFAAIETSSPQLVKYQYILEGYDKEWSPPANQTSATYGNINEGTYTFKVKAQSPFGIWSVPIIYKFKVRPPWWRSWWAYILYLSFFLSAIWFVTWYRSRKLKQENTLLEDKIYRRTTELRNSLEELKEAQDQLIQREKMASLGELTAGIAHEIQNPLNFVNNFSEVSAELVDDMNTQLQNGNSDEARVIALDLKQNLEKINHHGKRAGDIVKGMLQHSRNSSGEKESTDMNKLVDEYLRLSYHGLRAKDKTFDSKFTTDLDPAVGNLSVVPQDIGRVLLNLINNAFYAVAEKQRQNIGGYDPTVSINTMKKGDQVWISVRDNGNGIEPAILDKIFQPFFTTKPTGQGTGLGLSMSYDIIKAHGGILKVETVEGKGSEFIIQLPRHA